VACNRREKLAGLAEKRVSRGGKRGEVDTACGGMGSKGRYMRWGKKGPLGRLSKKNGG